MMLHVGLLQKYRSWLPVTEKTPALTLGEGDTPLVRADRLSDQLDLDLWLKLEGCNPTGSFKDRGMVLALARAVEAGSRAVICASTGNTAASAAAYAARAGLEAVVVVPAGHIALGKLSQALIHGARVLAVRGNFDAALGLVRSLAARHPVALVNSLNPYRLEGQKTGAFEICDALGDAPAVLSLPVGNAGNITAYWQGFREYQAGGQSRSLPRLFGFQAEGAAPIVRGTPIAAPQTVATAIRIGNPASWARAVAALAESDGRIDTVTDAEILAAQRRLAATEGVFCEPASAAAVAGVIQARQRGLLPAGTQVVCVLTGHGLKDPETAVLEAQPPVEVEADLPSMERVLGWI